ncbi:hypothetical protein CQW23_10618 [Capsicum baccatum]|uniref:Vesicle-fusing ATPase n=1 Tax=Capsicum baccatum TaxID=33114 RepID=A0A2G2X0A1_CAPBA|nr:hypothetical protein CQW23_10618 [Capsicum baccatum]
MQSSSLQYQTDEYQQCSVTKRRWLLKWLFLRRAFILAYNRCKAWTTASAEMMCSQKEAMAERCIALKLALAGPQTTMAEMTATAESWAMRNCNCCETEQVFEAETKSSCFTKFKVPKCRKLHIFSKKRTEAHGPKDVLRRDFNIEEFQAEMTSLGFGGVSEQLKDAIWKLIVPRCMPRALSREIGIQPKKGLIIHGPPGAGKALVARCLSEILNAKVKVVRASEIIGTLEGSSEKNLRDVFAPSIKDFEQMGEESPVHVIIFEEIDAIAGKRVTELLCFFCFGVPGRFGLHLRIDLPDEDARLEILQSNSKRIQKCIFFDNDIDLSAIAAATQGFSRVDLESLLHTALEYALARNFQGHIFNEKDIQIKKVDVEIALKDFGKKCF